MVHADIIVGEISCHQKFFFMTFFLFCFFFSVELKFKNSKNKNK